MRRILLISLICFFGLPFTPWWMFWIILGVGGYFTNTYRDAIRIGITAATLTWGIKLGIGVFTGGSILMQRVADMMGLGSSLLLILVTLVLAVIMGGLSAVSGHQLKMLFLSPNSSPKNM